jgi:hypothetical protein
VRIEKTKPQVSPLRYAPVEMTNLLLCIATFSMENQPQLRKQICHLDRSVA